MAELETPSAPLVHTVVAEFARELRQRYGEAVNEVRLFGAAFHAARARLYAEDLEPRTHAGVQHLWNVHLILPGRYEAATSRLLSRLQKFREEADYAQAFVVDEAGAREELDAARGLVERIRRELA